MKAKPRVAGHKGACAYMQGNTLASFDLAVTQGADCIELDVQCTSDQHIVVYDRRYTTYHGHEIPTAHLTRAQISAALSGKLGPSSHRSGVGEAGVLTLGEALDFLKARDVEVLIEMKNGLLLQPQDLGERVSLAVAQAKMASRTYVMSFDHELILSMRDGRRLRTGLLFVGRLANLEDMLDFTGAAFIETRNDFVDRRLVDRLHAHGCEVFGWSTVDESEMTRLCEIGIDVITTDAPDIARRLIDGLGGDLRYAH